MNTQTKNIPLKGKDEQLRQAVQGSKLINLRYNLSEIALIAGIVVRTAQYKKDQIERYWNEESITPDEDKKFLLERSIEVGIDNMLTEKDSTLESAYGVILGTYLKVETVLFDNVGTLKEMWTIGRHITNVYRTLSRFKKKQGISIHSVKNKSAKYLLGNKDILDNFFVRSDDYHKDIYAKRWTSTELLTTYIEISNNILLDCIILKPHIFKSIYSPLYMSPPNDAKNNNKYNYLKNIRSYNIYPKLLININDLRHFEIDSVFSLLTRVVGIQKDVIHIPVKHESDKSYEFYGRTYNIFCSLHSYERLQLGFIGYDMSAALQTISLQLIKGTRDEYPMLWDYTNKPGYKKQIRTEIANDLNIPIDDVKSKLTAFAHGSIKEIKRHKYYKVFQAESGKLRRAVLKHVRENAPKVLERAIEQSKRELPEALDWLDVDNFETSKEMRDKASVFFFVWTWHERKVREAMIDALGDNEASEALEVHDAVYSRKDIAPEILEKEVYAQTGFTIKIEQEKP